MRALYDAYIQAKRRCKEDTSKLSYDAVSKSVQKQIPELMTKYKAKAVDFKVVIRDGRAHLQGVETGLMNDEIVEVVAGLEHNEFVVLAPETSLKDGLRVRPIERPSGVLGQPPDRD